MLAGEDSGVDEGGVGVEVAADELECEDVGVVEVVEDMWEEVSGENGGRAGSRWRRCLEVMRVSKQLLQLGTSPRWFVVVGRRKFHLPLACLVSSDWNVSELCYLRRGCPWR